MKDKTEATFYDFTRILKYYQCSSIDCDSNCPFHSINCGISKENYNNCKDFLINYPMEVNTIILDWIKKHPIKTYKDDFLEKFPRARLHENFDYPLSCRRDIYDTDCLAIETGQPNACEDCWNEPISNDLKG